MANLIQYKRLIKKTDDPNKVLEVCGDGRTDERFRLVPEQIRVCPSGDILVTFTRTIDLEGDYDIVESRFRIELSRDEFEQIVGAVNGS